MLKRRHVTNKALGPLSPKHSCDNDQYLRLHLDSKFCESSVSWSRACITSSTRPGSFSTDIFTHIGAGAILILQQDQATVRTSDITRDPSGAGIAKKGDYWRNICSQADAFRCESSFDDCPLNFGRAFGSSPPVLVSIS